jgi:hypothetical protein
MLVVGQNANCSLRTIPLSHMSINTLHSRLFSDGLASVSNRLTSRNGKDGVVFFPGFRNGTILGPTNGVKIVFRAVIHQVLTTQCCGGIQVTCT